MSTVKPDALNHLDARHLCSVILDNNNNNNNNNSLMLSFNLRYVMGVRQSRVVKEKLRVETLNTQRQICLVGKCDDRQICRHRAHASIFCTIKIAEALSLSISLARAGEHICRFAKCMINKPA